MHVLPCLWPFLAYWKLPMFFHLQLVFFHQIFSETDLCSPTDLQIRRLMQPPVADQLCSVQTTAASRFPIETVVDHEQCSNPMTWDDNDSCPPVILSEVMMCFALACPHHRSHQCSLCLLRVPFIICLCIHSLVFWLWNQHVITQIDLSLVNSGNYFKARCIREDWWWNIWNLTLRNDRPRAWKEECFWWMKKVVCGPFVLLQSGWNILTERWIRKTSKI